ncbi:nuclear transport factor 2 family protein [Massilia sp. TS11]|uniref:nuclear transport factor 2 family protein n=1 Tax=Massilia sp. TS11 TaxID=2908003 RepID=UPI001ED9D231|nr:nuclear transport factor 2 family protein [Massilia sp. TS11]MCG2585244.1 nuclear transport factor 2 family protein [Massilia sp. TS11]
MPMLSLLFLLAAAPDAASEEAIRSVVARYAQAWAEGNAAQMQTTLTPQFQQQVAVRQAQKPDSVRSVSGLLLLDQTGRGYGRSLAPALRQPSIRVLDVTDGMASVVFEQGGRHEALQLLLIDGQWRIQNALTTAKE